MGLSFDDNGMYIGWSNLFDYSSIDTIIASENLPIPKKVKYVKTDTGFNIDSYISLIKQVQNDSVKRIKAYADLINALYKDGINDNNTKEISYTDYYGDIVLLQLGEHEFTIIPTNLLEAAIKNFISSHIQNTIQFLGNMIRAYSPVEIEDLRDAAEKSPKGELTSKLTLMNPITKLRMLVENITGKNVIGIAANGEKASFMWHYYINDIIRRGNEDLEYIEFKVSSNRIEGRSKGLPISKVVTTLPNVNIKDISSETLLYLGEIHTGNIYVDLMISLLLSAATDSIIN